MGLDFSTSPRANVLAQGHLRSAYEHADGYIHGCALERLCRRISGEGWQDGRIRHSSRADLFEMRSIGKSVQLIQSLSQLGESEQVSSRKTPF
jgi:hypothetical protein